METFDLEPYTQYMTNHKLVPEHQIPYYVKWVSLFLTSELPPMATSPRDRLQAFSDMLAQNQTIQDWQLRQAMRAVELYIKVFLSVRLLFLDEFLWEGLRKLWLLVLQAGGESSGFEPVRCVPSPRDEAAPPSCPITAQGLTTIP